MSHVMGFTDKSYDTFVAWVKMKYGDLFTPMTKRNMRWNINPTEAVKLSESALLFCIEDFLHTGTKIIAPREFPGPMYYENVTLCFPPLLSCRYWDEPRAITFHVSVSPFNIPKDPYMAWTDWNKEWALGDFGIESERLTEAVHLYYQDIEKIKDINTIG